MDNDSVKEEIKRRLSIEDVVSRHVTLQRAGSRLRARCPFHQEKTPSFYVNPALGLWKCFGCGAGGDIFEFVMRIEGLTFAEAAERLAERVGLQWRPGPGDEARTRRRQLMRRANEVAVAFFQEALSSVQGRGALEYLHHRGFTDQTIARFRLGFAPDSWDALLRHLRSHGIDDSVAAEAGLARERPGGGYYDVFRARVMFPIVDVSGRVIGFGGRALDPDDPAKYLNTPDTPMFKKGQNVYALDLARPAITQQKAVILVEGYTDVLALHQAGVENVVACLGTALTADHLRLLSRYAEEIILAYDADAAGIQAAARNIPLLESCPADVRIVVLPAGLDPDECVRRDGVQGFEAVLANRTSPVEYELKVLFARHAPAGADGLTRAAREAVDVLLRVPDRTRREEYLARAADLWGEGNPARTEAMEGALRLEMRRRLAERRAPGTTRRASGRDMSYVAETLGRMAQGTPPGIVKAEREIVAAALTNQEHAVLVCSSLAPDEFLEPAHQEIVAAVCAHLATPGAFTPREIIANLPQDGAARAEAAELAFLPEGPPDLEVLERAIANLKAYLTSGRHRGHYEIPPDLDALPPEPVEDFEALKRRVAEKLNAGVLDPDDPDIALFKTHAALAHGRGSLDYAQVRGQFAVGPEFGGPDRTAPGRGVLPAPAGQEAHEPWPDEGS